MDRCTVNIAKAQVGFYDVIINPGMTAAAEIMPEINQNLNHLESNKACWQQRNEEYEENM
jgi:hypothetical protein